MRELQGPTTSIGAIMNNSEAATPKFEAKRHGASDHSNNCRLVPLANILPQTLQALLAIAALGFNLLLVLHLLYLST